MISVFITTVYNKFDIMFRYIMTVKGNLSMLVDIPNKLEALHTDFELDKNRNLLELVCDFFS